MAGANKPLTDSEIREKFDIFNEDIMKLGATVMAFERILLKKGYATESEIAATTAEVAAEVKAEVARVQRSIRRGPSGSVQ
jgi:TPP-dependent pyruvate/acetoin dehydrogenase alpha subunit